MTSNIEQKGVRVLKEMLMKFHAISKTQALYILDIYGVKNPKKQLEFLTRKGDVTEGIGQSIAVNPYVGFNVKTSENLWQILLRHESLDITQSYMVSSSGDVVFTNKGQIFRVTSLDDGQETQQLKLLAMTNEFGKDITFITVVEYADVIPSLVAASKGLNINVLPAVKRNTDENGIPSYAYAKINKGKKG